MTEIINQNISVSWKFDKAKVKELVGLIKNQSWKIVCRRGITTDASILKRSFVLAVKDEGTSK